MSALDRWLNKLLCRPATVKILYDAIKSAGDDAATKAALQQQGNVVMLNPQPFSARVKAETAQYAEIIKRANIKLE